MYHTCFSGCESKIGPILGHPKDAAPHPPLAAFWWHPSCRMVVGHPHLTWGTVLRDLGLQPSSSDSSLRWEPRTWPHLEVCRRLAASGLCFGPGTSPPFYPFPSNPHPLFLDTTTCDVGSEDPTLHPTSKGSHVQALPSHLVVPFRPGKTWTAYASTLQLGCSSLRAPLSPPPSPLTLPSVMSSSLHNCPLLRPHFGGTSAKWRA